MSSNDQQLEALNSLISGVRLAQSRGCYSLEEAHTLCSSLMVFTESPEAKKSPTPAATQPARAKRKAK